MGGSWHRVPRLVRGERWGLAQHGDYRWAVEGDGALAMGFFDIADTAVERWKAGRRNDAIVIAIIYNYRHGIELALKAGIREGAACLRGDYSDYQAEMRDAAGQ